MNILRVSSNEIGLWMNIFWTYRSRYTSCVGTRPAAKIGKLTACPPKEEVAASAVVSTAADRSRASWTMFKTQKFIVSQKPNFYTELGCEVSGDAARLDTPPASALDGLI